MSRAALRLITFPERRRRALDAELERTIDQLVLMKAQSPHGLAVLAKTIEDFALDCGWKAGRKARAARPHATSPSALDRLRLASPGCANVIDDLIDDMLDEITKGRA
jgi:hypothetical protein